MLSAALLSRVHFSLCQLMSMFLVRRESKGAQIPANTCNKTFFTTSYLFTWTVCYFCSQSVCVCVLACVCVAHVRALREDPETLLNRESF